MDDSDEGFVNFGRLVREARKSRGWSQDALAAAVFDNPGRRGFISEIENGKRPQITLQTVLNIARVLEIPASALPASLRPAPAKGSDDTTDSERLIALQRMVGALYDREESSAREAGIKEGLLIALARRYAEDNPRDFDEALAGLENALRVAAEQAAALPGNVDDAVQAVLAEVARLNGEGRIDDAAELIAQEAARTQAGLLRLYDRGIAQAVLTNAPEDAARYEMQKIDLDGGSPAARFAALRQVQDRYYVRGRDRGVSFDLRTSVALAEIGIAAAPTDVDRGAALNDKAISLATLGARSGDAQALQDAVTAYRAALEVHTRDALPVQWAMTMESLAIAHLSLAALPGRSEPCADLAEALAAVDGALEVFSPDGLPFNHAKAARLRDDILADRARLGCGDRPGAAAPP